MLTVSVDHPEVENFITSKTDKTKITGANISVKITDEFINNVQYSSDPKYKDIWNKLVHQATTTAEPGVLFWDKIKSESPADCYEQFQTISTNPCGEIPLSTYDSCRLLSINLYNFVDGPFTKKASFNFGKLKEISYIAQKLMDDIVDLEEEKINKILDKIERDPESEEIKRTEKNLWLKIKKTLLEGRRTGLSGIGLGDTLAALNIKYSEGLEMAESIYKTLAISSYKSSIDMAKDRGTFLVYNKHIEGKNPFIRRIYNELDEVYKLKLNQIGRRNIANLTIPPSGSLAILAKITSGIEPVFQLSYKRRRKVDENHPNKVFKDNTGDWWEENEVFHPKLNIWKEHNIGKSIEDSPYFGSTANEIDPIKKVKLQGAIQKWIDHSISVTTNLKEGTTEETVSDIYFEAWKSGCKGATIYVNGSRDGVLINNDSKKEELFEYHQAPKRPKELKAIIHKTKVQGINYGIVIGLYKEKPYELFCIPNWGGSDLEGTIVKIRKKKFDFISDKLTIEDLNILGNKQERTLNILLSGILRHGTDPNHLIKWIDKCDLDIIAYENAIKRIIRKYIIEKSNVEKCPECEQETLINEGGCKICTNCGHSKCN